jgi:hypothetical protein
VTGGVSRTASFSRLDDFVERRSVAHRILDPTGEVAERGASLLLLDARGKLAAHRGERPCGGCFTSPTRTTCQRSGLDRADRRALGGSERGVGDGRRTEAGIASFVCSPTAMSAAPKPACCAAWPKAAPAATFARTPRAAASSGSTTWLSSLALARAVGRGVLAIGGLDLGVGRLRGCGDIVAAEHRVADRAPLGHRVAPIFFW